MNKYEPYATFAKGMPVPHAGLKPGAYVAWVVRKDPATPKRSVAHRLQWYTYYFPRRLAIQKLDSVTKTFENAIC